MYYLQMNCRYLQMGLFVDISNDLEISSIELEISPIELQICGLQLEISSIQ